MTYQTSNHFIKSKDVLFTHSYRENAHYRWKEINNDVLEQMDTFIFIVDLPDQVGGVRFFLDTILSKYKTQTIFVVAKNINKQLNLIINNEYILKDKFTLDESILFIEKYKPKINKIFFNHTLGHEKMFIEKLFTLHKHTTFITHDYELVNHKPQSYYKFPIQQTHYLNLNQFDKIITQNVVNLNIFKRYIYKPINIIELPDVKVSKKRIKTTNQNTVIGIIGSISIEKGKEILQRILHFYKDSAVTIVVFGNVRIPNFDNYYPYNNVDELNTLFIRHKPNMLLELSLWPETYSYTLTLSMLTRLPILCLKKTFPSVIEHRLSQRRKVYYFTNQHQLTSLIHKYKQDYFYTIDDTIYFDSQWSNYFKNERGISKKKTFRNIANKNIVFVTSKIIVSEKKLSYVEKRSIYSKQERIVQTINTIHSIRKYIPDAHIVLLDNSVFNYFEYSLFENLVDTFINITNSRINYFTDVFEYKAFGEISQTLQFLELFLKEDYTKCKHFFKISGRYEINNEFYYQQYDNDLTIFKRNKNIPNKKYYYTCFYKLNKNLLKEVQTIFMDLINYKERYMNEQSDLEVIFPNAIIDKIHLVSNLGIVENIGVWKQITHI